MKSSVKLKDTLISDAAEKTYLVECVKPCWMSLISLLV
jgi:hypothetical protein